MAAMTLPIKEFKTGSRGFYANGKIEIDGKRYQAQISSWRLGARSPKLKPNLNKGLWRQGWIFESIPAIRSPLYPMPTIESARAFYTAADSVHDFDHILRVLALAERVGRVEGADLEIVRAAVLLHDPRAPRPARKVSAPAITRSRPRRRGAGPRAGRMTAARPCSTASGPIAFAAPEAPRTLEAKVLFDCDKLDVLGAIGAVRTVGYAALAGQPLTGTPSERFRHRAKGARRAAHPITSSCSSSPACPSACTPTARAIAAERHQYLAGFFERLAREIAGEADRPALARRVNWRKVALFVLALLLFIFAPAPQERGQGPGALRARRPGRAEPANALGFGWLFAYAALSGLAGGGRLTLFDAGAIDDVGTFAMIAGSRLGAAFIVLAIGFVYTVRGHEQQGSLAMGLLSFIITAAIYLPGLAVGYWLLQTARFDRPPVRGDRRRRDHRRAVRPWSAWRRPICNWLVFAVGWHLLVPASTWSTRPPPAMRRAPDPGGAASALSSPGDLCPGPGCDHAHHVGVGVAVGAGAALGARLHPSRERDPLHHGGQYHDICGHAGGSLLLNNPRAFTVVLVEMVSVALVSLVFLLLIYRPYERAVLRLVELIGHRRRNMAVFLAIILGVPIALMLLVRETPMHMLMYVDESPWPSKPCASALVRHRPGRR